MPRSQWVDVAYPYRLRGAGNQQNNTGLLWPGPTYRAVRRGDGTVSFDTLYSEGLALSYVSLHNRSGSTGVHGIGGRLPNRYWIAGAWDDDAATPFTDDTTDAQSTTAADFALETTTASDGFIVASQVPFNALSIDIGTASAGGSPVRAARYTNSAGDGWIDFANLFIQTGASGQLSATGTTDANEALLVWGVPTNWGQVQSSGLSGIPAGYYAVNVRATTAPSTTAAVADSLSVYRIYLLTEGLADNGTLEYTADALLYLQPTLDAVVALFETANNQNRATVCVRTA